MVCELYLNKVIKKQTAGLFLMYNVNVSTSDVNTYHISKSQSSYFKNCFHINIYLTQSLKLAKNLETLIIQLTFSQMNLLRGNMEIYQILESI